MRGILIAGVFPVAGIWILVWMGFCAVVLLAVFPWILKRRRRLEQRALHDRVEKATADILEDGVVEGPKGPRAPHIRWCTYATGRTPRDGPPKGRSYNGGPWPE